MSNIDKQVLIRGDMNKAKVALAVTMVVIAGMIAVGSTALPRLLPPTGYTYQGKALMSETEYQEFKQLMAAHAVSDYQAEVLNIGYPILIQYKFTQTQTIDVPDFVNKTSSVEVERYDTSILALLAGIPLAFGILLLSEDN